MWTAPGRNGSEAAPRSPRVRCRRLTTPPAPVEAFLSRFNTGDYWGSHEVLEAVWRVTRSRFYHGLILYASAWVHVRRGNPAGARAQAGKALAELSPYLPGYLGLDVAAIMLDIHRLAGAPIGAERVDTGSWLAGMSPPHLEFRPDRIRGDESEINIPE